MLKEFHSYGIERLSESLNPNIALDIFEETTETGKTMRKATHASFVAVYNKLRNEENFECNFTYKPIECLCDIKDCKVVLDCVLTINGKQYFSIGETSRKSLSNDISTSYPALMAMYRGFDLCFKQFLDLEENIFSDAEIPVETNSKVNELSSEKVSNSSETKTETANNTETPTEETSVQAASSENVLIDPTEDEPLPELDLSKPVEENPITKVDSENYKITFGTHKNKTLKEIHGEKPGYLPWVLEQDWLRDDSRRYIEAFLSYYNG